MTSLKSVRKCGEVLDLLDSELRALRRFEHSHDISLIRDVLRSFYEKIPHNPPSSFTSAVIPTDVVDILFINLIELTDIQTAFKSLGLVCKAWYKKIQIASKWGLLHNNVLKRLNLPLEDDITLSMYLNKVLYDSDFTKFNDVCSSIKSAIEIDENGYVVAKGFGCEPIVWFSSLKLRGSWFAQFEIEFSSDAMDDVGRHGGIHFFVPPGAGITRWDSSRGWLLDWIDRHNDHGYRLNYRRNGRLPAEFISKGKHLKEPAKVWGVKYDENKNIWSFFSDGKLLFQQDATRIPADGLFTFWCYSNCQTMTIKSLHVVRI